MILLKTGDFEIKIHSKHAKFEELKNFILQSFNEDTKTETKKPPTKTKKPLDQLTISELAEERGVTIKSVNYTEEKQTLDLGNTKNIQYDYDLLVDDFHKCFLANSTTKTLLENHLYKSLGTVKDSSIKTKSTQMLLNNHIKLPLDSILTGKIVGNEIYYQILSLSRHGVIL